MTSFLHCDANSFKHFIHHGTDLDEFSCSSAIGNFQFQPGVGSATADMQDESSSRCVMSHVIAST